MPSSQNSERQLGSQTPSIHIVRPYDTTEAEAAAKVGIVLGVVMDEWQRRVQNDWLAVDGSGRYVHTRCGLSVPRQNGKTADVELRIMFGALFKGEVILYTAHDYSTVTKLFDRLQVFFGEKARDPDAQYPDINRRVRAVRRAAGKEAIFLRNGGAIYLSTRTKTAKRGYTVDVVVFDEAQELTDVQMKALMSTASAAPLGNPQYIFLGTPPGPESFGDVFSRIRDNVLAGTEHDITWSEWSVSEIGDVSDVGRVYATNPALGTRLSMSVIKAELGTLSPLSFAQERLGYWLPKNQVIPAINIKEWKKRAIDSPPIDGKVAYGVKFSHDGKCVALAVARLPEGGTPHVELIDCQPLSRGTGWLADWLRERQGSASCVVIDGKNGSASLIEKIGRAPKGYVEPASTAMVIAASSMLAIAVEDESLTHFNQDQLNESVETSTERKIGRGGGWGFDGEMPAPIEAVALAHLGVLTSKRNPGRKVRLL